jgi:hypothetical protein
MPAPHRDAGSSSRLHALAVVAGCVNFRDHRDEMLFPGAAASSRRLAFCSAVNRRRCPGLGGSKASMVTGFVSVMGPSYALDGWTGLRRGLDQSPGWGSMPAEEGGLKKRCRRGGN